MQRYTLFIGLVGILAGISLLFYVNMFPKPTPTPVAALSAETLVYNVGSAHSLPGTSSMLYENSALGLRFGYPKSYGEVVVEKNGGQITLSFSPSGATNDPRRTTFLVAQALAPTENQENWGDLSWYIAPDPRWAAPADVCALIKVTSTDRPTWVNNLIESSECVNLQIGDLGAIKLISSTRQVYVVPTFQTAVDGMSFDAVAISNEDLLNSLSFEHSADNLEKLVNSLEFIPTTE